MSTEQEHFYFVDPGIGKKGKGCPYTYYKDGHDVRSFITPPKGYELAGFKFEPYPEDKFYDGKIVAQFDKIPFSDKLNQNIGMYILGFIAIIGILGILAFYTFDFQNKPKLAQQPVQNPKTEIQALPVDTIAQDQVSDTASISEGFFYEDTLEELANEETALEEVIKENTEIAEATLEENIQVENMPIEVSVESEVKESENATASVTEPTSQPTETEETEEVLTKEQFRQEFWNLIHHKETHMRTYGNLYRKYKGLKLKTKEFYYLYLTILENTTAFDAWKAKLVNIPDDELKSIHTINALKQKLEEYE